MYLCICAFFIIHKSAQSNLKLQTTSLGHELYEIVFKHTLFKISTYKSLLSMKLRGVFDTQNVCSCLAYLHLKLLLLTNSIYSVVLMITLVGVLVYLGYLKVNGHMKFLEGTFKYKEICLEILLRNFIIF